MSSSIPRPPRASLAALVALSVLAAPAAAVPYVLVTPPSQLQAGCFGPCECAVTTQPTFGSFDLVETGVDPLYTHYAIQRFIASFNNGPGAVSIVGSGTYRIGGEFALMQEMTLDLQVWGGPVQHFDSGLVPVRAPFPEISVSCPLHGFACHDSVVMVDAKADDPAGAGPQPPRAGIEAVVPNPFRSGASVVLGLDRPGPVELSVLDLSGRRVRVLASAFMDGGPRTLVWDGHGDDGRASPAGLYWLVLRWAGGTDRRRLIKLE